ncbi:MAG: fumarylacetoacetate hydrolase family protein [Rothia sp. (in: high G+C Gram-positive bacteria)]|uniref:fumarylacetoacetate hydrolase family protein n=1 Tax=Rothia sp. (in: high G+C Gram-positive bacteria) TaxID=1885016 RepID=UPI0026DF6AD5|nr:fumarylacetoacetate hydrolase family protein [Rothia sp. (in: high G+C Gram-positive bacteria)]MDO5750992.1 fumarylacetoacetate hydrolase family protein [Rothia sp. (in: high G+C Gram-positive bacteria)]
MRIARFTVDNDLHFGIVEGEEGAETLRVIAGDPFYSGIEPTGATYPLEQVRLLSPMIPRSKVIGTIANWAGTEAPASPQFFIKPNTTVIGPGDPVTLPEYSESVSPEGELAVIIGRIAKSVPLERVHEVIFGYTIANDLTARDMLETDVQWTRAKCFDGSTPLGPWIETELDTDSLNITTWVDGDTVQEGNTADMHYSVAELVSAASEIFTLLPGDVLLTGSAPGATVLRDGQEIEIEIEGIGSLITRVRDEAN